MISSFGFWSDFSYFFLIIWKVPVKYSLTNNVVNESSSRIHTQDIDTMQNHQCSQQEEKGTETTNPPDYTNHQQAHTTDPPREGSPNPKFNNHHVISLWWWLHLLISWPCTAIASACTQ